MDASTIGTVIGGGALGGVAVVLALVNRHALTMLARAQAEATAARAEAAADREQRVKLVEEVAALRARVRQLERDKAGIIARVLDAGGNAREDRRRDQAVAEAMLSRPMPLEPPTDKG